MKVTSRSILALTFSMVCFACSSDKEDPFDGGEGGETASGGETTSGGTASGGTGPGAGGRGGTSSGGSSSAGRGGRGGQAGSSGSPSGSAGSPTQPIPPTTPPGSCGLDEPAFCDEFEKASPGGNGGDLDERAWAFNRWGHESRQFFVRIPAATIPEHKFPARFCGKAFSGLRVPDDVQICDGPGPDGSVSGRLNEVFNDQGDFAINSMRVRQPFDFTGRTGTLVFDVDAKINPHNIGHGWWIEVFITEDPAPLPYHEAPGVLSYPRNGIGFAFQGFNQCAKDENLWNNALNRVFVTRNHEIVHDYSGGDFEFETEERKSGCFKTEDQKPNKFKFMISKSQVEIYITDSDAPANLRLLTRVKNLDLSFERGYVHLQHAQYNAHKDGGVTSTQTYSWDNVGFDGPTYPTPRAYDVPDNDEPDIDGTGGRLYGYYLTDDAWTAIDVPNVDTDGAVRATFSFTVHTTGHGRALEYRFNGGPTHEFAMPMFGIPGGVRGFSQTFPVDELVDGTNKVEVRMKAPQNEFHEAVANMDITLEVPQ